jgi:curved DNA-binding protein
LDGTDYYHVLGVSRVANAEELKKAFRQMARKYHPDLSREPDAETRMKEVNEAFATLSDPQRRAAYDRLARGAAQAPGRSSARGAEFKPPPWQSGFSYARNKPADEEPASFTDFFSDLFGANGTKPRSSKSSHSRRRGEDHHASVMLDIEDAYRGGVKAINLRVPREETLGQVAMVDRTINVNIPSGVHEGQMIRLAGQGKPGPFGSQPGDLYLEVRFKSHPRYRTEGRDVYAILPIAPWEAALGATVKAPVPGGTIEVHIPAGSQSGRKLRLKGKGIPAQTPGDLYLVLDVVLPPADNIKARQLYQAMAHDLAFNPRQGIRA